MRRFSIVTICILSLWLTTCLATANGKPKKTPPGLAKKQGQSQGQSQRPGNSGGFIPPGQAQKLQAPAMGARDELKQNWCLERNGQVNALVNNMLCDCVTETHAIMFSDDDDWTELLGVVLSHAVTTGKQPGLVLFSEEDGSPQRLQLNAVLHTFQLPVTLWKLDMKEE